MKSLEEFIKEKEIKNTLFIFPHPDDVTYVSSGLIQLLNKIGIESSLICLTSGNNDETTKSELSASAKVLGLKNIDTWDYKEQKLFDSAEEWMQKLEKMIRKTNPDMIVSFDTSGITGNLDHIATSITTLKILKSLKSPAILLWRVADNEEGKFFKVKSDPKIKGGYILNLNFESSTRKLKAIFAHKSKIVNLVKRLQVIDLYLFDHKETYHLVDLSRNYSFDIKTK